MSEADVESVCLKGIRNWTRLKYLGFTDQNQFVVVLNQSLGAGRGYVYWIDAKTGRLAKAAPTGILNSNSPVLSADGRFMSALDDSELLFDHHHTEFFVHYIRVFPSSSLKPLKVIDIGKPHNTHGVTFLRPNPDEVIVWATSDLPYHGDTALQDDHLELWNWRKGLMLRRLTYDDARSISDIKLSPDRKRISCVFFDYVLDNDANVDTLDAVSGEHIWGIKGRDALPVGDPCFYLQDGRLVSKDRVYDAEGGLGKQLLPGNTNRHCLAGVPDTDLMFFGSPNGVELWNIKTSARIKRWPQIRNVGELFLSPDKKTFAVICSTEAPTGAALEFWHHTKISFWEIDPKLLGPDSH